MVQIKNFINGEWSGNQTAIHNINPANTNDVINQVLPGGVEEVYQAVEAACKAFPAWRDVTPQVRHDLLDAIGNAILARRDTYGAVLSREEGKILAEGVGETVRAGQVFKYFAGEALRCSGELLGSVRAGIDIDVIREPIGVVGIITPWNFPVAIPAWKIAPALAFGNCVVFKPATATPGMAHILAKLFEEFGGPPGVFNMVLGSGSEVGDTLVSHPDVAAISFTGSVGTGSAIVARCGVYQKKVQVEMGGKNPMIVMDDADLSIAVPACVNGAFFSTGQRCTASSRFIVHRTVHDEFVTGVSKAMAELIVGDPFAATTDIGPVIDQEQLDSNLAYVALAAAEGAIVTGGERLELDNPGFYQAPALFMETNNQMRINQEEIFGPCATVIRVDDFDEAIMTANDVKFGLSSGICTQSLKYAREFKRRADAGVLMVNLPTAGLDFHVPFGGRKASSYGPKEQGHHAIEFYTMVKTAYTFA